MRGLFRLFIIDIAVEVDESSLNCTDNLNRDIEGDRYNVLEPMDMSETLPGSLGIGIGIREQGISPSNQTINPRVIVTSVIAIQPRCTLWIISRFQYRVSDSTDYRHCKKNDKVDETTRNLALQCS